jgi:hypothetical protein
MFYFNRPRLKAVGPIAPARCHACNTDGWARLQKRRKWLTFLWIPLLPMGRATYEVVCENCHRRKPIRGDDVEHAKEQVERTEKLIRGELPWDDYAATVDDFSAAVSDDIATPPADLSQSDGPPRGFA